MFSKRQSGTAHRTQPGDGWTTNSSAPDGLKTCHEKVMNSHNFHDQRHVLEREHTEREREHLTRTLLFGSFATRRMKNILSWLIPLSHLRCRLCRHDNGTSCQQQQIADAPNASSTYHRQDPLGRSFREHLGSGDLVIDPALLQERPERFLVRGLLSKVQLIQHRRSVRGREYQR